MKGAAVSARARTRPDRGGDPLDGLVNLFDLGIVLAVAFLLAALASIDVSPQALADRDQHAEPIKLKPGRRIVGRGERLGTVYRLRDGRTVIVREEGSGD